MVRTFQTHLVRKTTELSSCLWEFQKLPKEAGTHMERVMVPSCWETYPGWENYRGKALYSRTFEAEGDIYLQFKGVSHTAIVYVDGVEYGSHYNAYTPFCIYVPNLSSGIHLLEVEVDNSFGKASALHVPNDYQSYGGISRGVTLEELNSAAIQWVHVTPKRIPQINGTDSYEADIELCVTNLLKTQFCGMVSISIQKKADLQEERRQIAGEEPVMLAPGETKTITFSKLPCPEVESWSPEHPALYQLQTVLCDEGKHPIDDWIDQIGFREISVQGKDILLNGKKLRIKGFCRHEDHPQYGCALPLSAMQYDLMLAKNLNANSIRTSHYPNDELFLDLCDEQGILVWEENHARGLSEEDMRNPNFDKQCQDCIEEMIIAHYNHPSIYIWGILNECASDTEYGRNCYQKQYEQIRSLDLSRPRSSASCQFKKDLCFGYPEVVSYNIYPMWYHDTPVKEYLDDLYQWVQTSSQGAGKPFLITETGAGAIYGYRDPSHVKWSEEYQVEALTQQLNAVLEQEGCSGIYIWQFADVRVCDSWFDKRPRTMNNKGIVDEYRRPKLSYEMVKTIFGNYGNYFSK